MAGRSPRFGCYTRERNEKTVFKNLNTGVIGVRVPFAEACRLAEDYGFSGIDVSVRDVEQVGSLEAVADLLGKHKLQVGAFSFPNQWLGSEEEWRKGLHSAPRYLAMGRALGACRVTSVIRAASDTLTYAENLDFHVRRLRPVALLLEDYGFGWGFEFLGPQQFRRDRKYTFVYDVDTCLELCNAVRDTTCGLLLDVWHWYTSGGSLEQIERLSDRKVVYVHLNDAPAGVPVAEQIDNIRCLPGETGVIDSTRVLQALVANGATAPVTVEPFSKKVNSLPPEEAVRVTAEALDSVWAEVG